MQKRLFIFCDGTWKDGVNKTQPPTNVGTLARCLEGVADDGYLQIVYYDSGVGNGTGGGITRGIDGATGRGIASKIRNAYSFLAHNYTREYPNDELEKSGCDEIILVGFSRGAFAVQCLASFISQGGLLQANYLYYLHGLFTLWANQTFSPVGRGGQKPIQRELEEYFRMFLDEGITYEVKIKACVVWDTVSSLGLPTPWSRPLSHVGNTIPKIVENAFHALALDERRAAFKPCIWITKEHPSTFVNQCWMLGSHSDIGGSGDAALGNVSLIWAIGLLQDRTGTKFNWNEIGKHVTHKFLEWNYDVNRCWGYFRQKSVLSIIPGSGQTTSPSLLWWILGISSRKINPEPVHDDHDLNINTRIHFTVRLMIANYPNAGRKLRGWRTVMSDEGSVHWERRGGILPEDRLGNDETAIRHELAILRSWYNDEFPARVTDRTPFATRVQALILNPRNDPHLDSFPTSLKENLLFVENRLAPHRKYP